jgi:hypothetical protein
LIPGLLQTAEYARALFLAQQTDTSDENIGALVAARLERQAILDRADPPDVVELIDESVLHRLIGSPQIMHEALVHLAELSRRPTSSSRSCRLVTAQIRGSAALSTWRPGTACPRP